MSVNTMDFEQVSTVLTLIVEQATGQTVQTPTDTGSFVSVAQIALRTGRDAVMNAISTIIGRTIFSVRPYSAKLTGLEMDTFRWGAMMRKLSIADNDWEDDPAYAYPVFYDAGQNPPDGEGLSVDRWQIKKPNILETNFYGQSIYSDHMTITEDQLETAFSGPEQLGSFLGLIMTNLQNRLESSNEAIRRGLVCNAIGAIYDENASDRVIHLLTEYNTLTGLSTPLTNRTVYQPDNFPEPFVGIRQWLEDIIVCTDRLDFTQDVDCDYDSDTIIHFEHLYDLDNDGGLFYLYEAGSEGFLAGYINLHDFI